MGNRLKKALMKYYSDIGEIERYDESHKQIMRLIYPLLKEVEKTISQNIEKEQFKTKIIMDKDSASIIRREGRTPHNK